MPLPEAHAVAERFLHAANAGAWDSVTADIHPAIVSRLRDEALVAIAGTLELRRLSQAHSDPARAPELDGAARIIAFGISADGTPELLDRVGAEVVHSFSGTPTVAELRALPHDVFLALYLAACSVGRPRHLLGIVPFGPAAAFAVWASDPPPESNDYDESSASDAPAPECVTLHRAGGRWWAVPDRWMMFFGPIDSDDGVSSQE